jgi:hypothetical protein
MKSLISKKVIIIFSVLIFIVASAVIVAFTTGNTHFPSLSDPDGIFYERQDDSGNVLYTITNKEMYEEIKRNDGVQQLLFMIDTVLLHEYLDELTDDEILDRKVKLIYGTSDAAEIAKLPEATKTSLEEAFEMNMVLSGYEGNELAYAALTLARENYARFAMKEAKAITDLNIAKEYINNTWEDIYAVRIRFTSSADAKDVLLKYHLLEYNTVTLREYKGFTYKDETLLDRNDELVQAYITIDTFYYDVLMNIVNLNDQIVYEKGTGNTYTGANDKVFTLDDSGNLLDTDSEVVIAHTNLFINKADAVSHKDANTSYYTVTKTDPFDHEENAVVKTQVGGIVVYTIDKNGKIYDISQNDVTATTDLKVNKVFTPIASVTKATVNNSTFLTDQEILNKYILMYNYVYGAYRDLLPENATPEDLMALDNPNLHFNYLEVKSAQASLATYMFKTLKFFSDVTKPFSTAPKTYAGANDTATYLVYKIHQEPKFDAEKVMFDHIESQIKIPTIVGGNITLPTSGWYGSTISWTSGNTRVISSKGVVIRPSEDTEVVLTYRISFNGETRSGALTIQVLASGNTVEVTPTGDTEVTFETILDDVEIYDQLTYTLIDAQLQSTNAASPISTYLVKLRQTYGFKIYDRFVGVGYTKVDKDYSYQTRGSKTLLATLSGRPGYEDEEIEFSADTFYEYALTKNSALYVMYASQFKELVRTSYFTHLFGTQTDLTKNKSDQMRNIVNYVDSIKQYYPYLKQLYESYNLSFPYASFTDYIYSEHNGAKTEYDLIRNSVVSTLQSYIIMESVDDLDIVELMYPTIEEYYDNYFSLNVNHLLIYFDFDEDGKPDDYFAYIDSLSDIETDEYETTLASLENEIRLYLGETGNTFTTLKTAYANATREHETWGTFKQKGFQIMNQSLNTVDSESVSHSLTYSGEYGVKDTYVQEFVDALIALYADYTLPQNSGLSEMMSQLVDTVNGSHIILVTKGDDFERPSARFVESDPSNPVYSTGIVNEADKPTLAQIQLYAHYYLYNSFYDLSNADVETTYNITLPKISATLRAKLAVFSDDVLQDMLVLGTVNVNLADRMQTGRFPDNDFNHRTTAQMLQQFVDTRDAYYNAVFGKYTD